MQIKKINNDKLKIIINKNDLNKKNININSFLSNSEETKKYFYELLTMAEKKYNFNIDDNNTIVETLSFNNNIFIITITKTKKNNNNLNYSKTNIFYFDNDNYFLDFINNINKKYYKYFELYKLNKKLYLILNTYNKKLNYIILEYANKKNNNEIIKDILLEYNEKN